MWLLLYYYRYVSNVTYYPLVRNLTGSSRIFKDLLKDLSEDLSKDAQQVALKILKDLHVSCQDVQGSLKILIKILQGSLKILVNILKDL